MLKNKNDRTGYFAINFALDRQSTAHKRTRPHLTFLAALVFSCACVASYSAFGIDVEKYAVRDLAHPVGIANMIAIGATESGEIICYGWRESEAPAVWLWLPQTGYGLPAGWHEIGSAVAPDTVRPLEVVYSPDMKLVGGSGHPSNALFAGIPLDIFGLLGTNATARTSILPERDTFLIAIADSGLGCGVLASTSPIGFGTGVWIDNNTWGEYAPPSAEFTVVIPSHLTDSGCAVGLALDPSQVADDPRAVVMTSTRTQFLDDLAQGKFINAVHVSKAGSIVATRAQADQTLHVCILDDLTLDHNVDRHLNALDFTPFLDRFASLDPTADVNSDGTITGDDVTEFMHRLSLSTGATLLAAKRAFNLIQSAHETVAFSAWPFTISQPALEMLRTVTSIPLPSGGDHTAECLEFVCGLSPTCCNTMWSESCESLAATYYANDLESSPVCALISLECCEDLCVLDPMCCDAVAWDQSCNDLVGIACVPDPGHGCPWIGQPLQYDPNFGGYCGENGGSTFPSPCFNECCWAHDICYGNCDRKKSCDVQFRACMQQKCETASASPIGSFCPMPLTNCLNQSYGYYAAVHLLGHDAYCSCCELEHPWDCQGIDVWGPVLTKILREWILRRFLPIPWSPFP